MNYPYTREEWSMLSSSERGECEEWTGAKTKGYGQRRVNGKLQYTHRLAWTDTYGDIPEETPFVLHHCDNPPCSRISHLFIGTAADNTADMVSKERNVPGTNPPVHYGKDNVNYKLSNAQKQEICNRYGTSRVTYRQLAKEYGVSHVHIGYIVHNRSFEQKVS